MPRPQHDTFYSDIYSMVTQIPAGRVVTYGELARLAGWPQHARMVGRALREVPPALHLPCHRVVNAAGRTAPGWVEQPQLLRSEGVAFKSNGCVDMRVSAWKPLESFV
ncbi:MULTISPECIES: MGMT family protein [unclassified Prevotella]|uniref:MGMT family protein n=1 Tax=unclassified Prevotella TaxID=2638335 RepID=UPI000512A242|nr:MULTISPECIES: methylated-DNA--[protein]-cysteine S-methyltransferase [unclassified Prevotella]KGI61349.1 cysteine methyltransferase [Prevotella sp. S7 MS 2]